MFAAGVFCRPTPALDCGSFSRIFCAAWASAFTLWCLHAFFDGFGLAGRCSLDRGTGSGFDCVLKLVLKRMSADACPPFSAAALLER